MKKEKNSRSKKNMIKKNNNNNKLNILDVIKNKKKLIIIVTIIIIIVTIALILFKILFIPLYNYNKANDYLAEKNYEKAIELYKKNKNYKDSKEKLEEAYYAYGIALIDGDKYEEAINVFKKSKGDDLNKYISYANAMIDFKDKKYNTALATFKDLIDFKKANEYANYCNLMLAEEKYKNGNLAVAKKLFTGLDKDLEFDGVKVSNRLETLEKYNDYVNLCGTWSGSNGKMSVRQTHDSTGSWDQWDGDYNAELKINCIINEDGSVTLKGDAKYYVYTNYSSLSKYLKTPQKSLTINKTVSSLPNEIASGNNVKLTYSNGKFLLNYDYNDSNSSMNFTYKYKSSITYNTRKDD